MSGKGDSPLKGVEVKVGHRDGVASVSMMMVGRFNAVGRDYASGGLRGNLAPAPLGRQADVSELLRWEDPAHAGGYSDDQ